MTERAKLGDVTAKPAWLTDSVETIIKIMARRYGHRNRNAEAFVDFRAEAVAKLARVADQHQGESKFEAFAARVVENMARDMARKRRVEEIELAEWCDPADQRAADYAESEERLHEATVAALAIVQDRLVTPGQPHIVSMLAECVELRILTSEECDQIETARRVGDCITLFRPVEQSVLFDITSRVAAECVRAAVHAPGSRRARYVFAAIRAATE